MTSHSEWGQETGAPEIAQTFSEQIRGRTILITGVSPGGLGYATALSIASQSPSLLILASRSPEKLEEVRTDILKTHPSTTVDLVILDLSSQESIRRAAAEVTQLTKILDVLINNAAVVYQTRHLTAEGIEAQFGTNHIGHFLFTCLLLPKLLASAQTSVPGSTRIINLTSAGHRLSPVRFHDYNFEGKPIPEEEEHYKPIPDSVLQKRDGYPTFIAYGQCKSANILFTVGLTKRLKDQGIVAYSPHPGSIATGLNRDFDEEAQGIVKWSAKSWKTLDQGAATTLVAAFDPALNTPEGIYLSDCQYAEPVSHASDPVLADRLWALSEELTGQKLKS
ncbi:NAD(P)-binding protein [Patellaria atrata CBS 101060]|uniref:NAD(P)-binding protein n=1 Tax=Patellaria atrata CBS 101060 TaxID=1346257 RepID=A0A9P4VKR8_9PEZI|nr:NAD(P)-binding protein [Patellaria atrata CBS 101060]